MRVGWGEALLIAAIVLLLVGAKRLPGLARSLGSAIREFRDALRGSSGQDHPDDQRRKKR